MATAIPLPRLGECSSCRREYPVRKDGRIPRHLIVGFREEVRCPGSEEPATVLPVTFARWLWSRRNGDDAAAQLAHFEFVGCTYRKTLAQATRQPSQVDWVTADDLHEELHNGPRRNLRPFGTPKPAADECTWLCRHLDAARAEYDRLMAEAS